MVEMVVALALVTMATWPGSGLRQKTMSPGKGMLLAVLRNIFVNVTVPYFVDVLVLLCGALSKIG